MIIEKIQQKIVYRKIEIECCSCWLELSKLFRSKERRVYYDYDLFE